MQLIEPHLPVVPNSSNEALPAEKQVTIGLWYLFHNETYRTAGASLGVAAASYYYYLWRVVRALLLLKDDFIKWPTGTRFQEISGSNNAQQRHKVLDPSPKREEGWWPGFKGQQTSLSKWHQSLLEVES